MNGKTKRRYEDIKFIHNLEPDYQNVHLEIPQDFREKILTKLTCIYSKQTANEYMPELERICKDQTLYFRRA